MAGIAREEWARVWAEAIKEAKAGNSSLKTKLETDPLLAAREFRKDFPTFPNPPDLLDDLPGYEVDQAITGVPLSKRTVPELEAIIAGNPKVPIKPNELKKV